ncbi:hypothetical protein Dsin_028140 [Dipteronia sinensis]|uniref:RNase H type-1 domain-containing protein n=1 Tax=Dipteronia sinensis TaxID=43782 RepID=A0AAD9ZQK1_9ROSI|nr:hypothetical protein Dsin_028140 [Dipteronia sinensis]
MGISYWYQIWRPPTLPFYNLNVDVALNSVKCVTKQIGACVSDVILVLSAEAKAILEGILMAGNRGLSPLVVESKVLNVVKLCNGEFSSRCEIDNIVSDIKMAFSIVHVSSISHVPRDCNKIAHGIANCSLALTVLLFGPLIFLVGCASQQMPMFCCVLLISLKFGMRLFYF